MSSLIVDFPNRLDETVSHARQVRVCFAPTSYMTYVQRYPEADRSKIWYSQLYIDEMKLANKQRVAETHKILESLGSRDPTDETETILEVDTFGIESLLTPWLIRKRIQGRRLVVRAVMKEQARQEDSDEFNSDRLAKVARKETEWATGRAHTIGLIQAQDKNSA